MQISKLSVRFLVLIAAAFAIVLAFASVGQGPQNDAHATTALVEKAVTCSDLYLDFPPYNAKGSAPTEEDLLVAKSLNRTEPDPEQPGPGPGEVGSGWHVTSVSYIGPDGPDVLTIPDKPPTNTNCKEDVDGANEMNPNLKYADVSANSRPPEIVGKVVDKSYDYSASEDGAGNGTCLDGIDNGDSDGADKNDPDCIVQGNALVYITCTQSENTGDWIRVDVNVDVDKDPETQNPGQVLFYVGEAPVAACDITGAVLYGAGNPPVAAYPNILISHTRATESTPGGLTATDWDNDGCSDWDELAAKPDNLGLDPFNPKDCDYFTGGNLSGVFDAMVKVPLGGDASLGFFMCLIRQEHAADNSVEAWSMCYSDRELGDPTSPIPDGIPGERGPDLVKGPPPPPPYIGQHPSHGNGSYDKIDDVMTTTTCFDVPGPSGPNFIAVVHMGKTDPIGSALGVKAQIAALAGPNPKIEGSVDIYEKQTDAACAAKTPKGGFGTLWLNFYPVGNFNGVEYDGAPWRPDPKDFDGDKCSDFNELVNKKDGNSYGGCGDDPFNPYDSDENYESVGSMSVTIQRAGWDQTPNLALEEDGAGPGTCDDTLDNGPDGATDGADQDCQVGVIPGSYLSCITSTTQDKPNGTNALATSIYCYTNNTATDVNATDKPGRKGDGISGSPPPMLDVWGDIDNPHTVLEGEYDKWLNQIRLSGCFASVEDSAAPGGDTRGPNIYWDMTVNGHTGKGTVDIYENQADKTDCNAGTTTGTPITAEVQWTEQQSSKEPFSDTPLAATDHYDTDQDGCSDTQELQSGFQAERVGGLRDAYNYWDFRDVPAGGALTRDKAVVIQDISAVVSRFGRVGNKTDDPINTANVAGTYHTAYDTSGGILGSSGAWNIRGPDGAIVIQDIQATVAQFGHNCL